MIKVLIVDDSALVRKLLGGVLAGEGDVEVGIARNGLEALEVLDRFQPDVVSLDVQMPGMDGLECLDRIMLQRPCPVLMVSTVTADGADATLEALRLGAVDFVAKPSGAVSLHMDEFAPVYLAKVRAAASARVPASRRLKDRVQFRATGAVPKRQTRRGETIDDVSVAAAQGAGLVLIGTSTGGPPALEAVLTSLPAKFPWPIVVAQHMPASFTGPLARRLDGLCELDVVEVSRATALTAGSVYIGRGDADIVISKRPSGLVALASPPRKDYPWHPSVDRMVRSALEHVPAEQVIGVLMTGMGNDGARAMAELRATGGRTIAEAEESAVVWGMPGELARTGGATYVLPLLQIANRLVRMVPIHAAGA